MCWIVMIDSVAGWEMNGRTSPRRTRRSSTETTASQDSSYRPPRILSAELLMRVMSRCNEALFLLPCHLPAFFDSVDRTCSSLAS